MELPGALSSASVHVPAPVGVSASQIAVGAIMYIHRVLERRSGWLLDTQSILTVLVT